MRPDAEVNAGRTYVRKRELRIEAHIQIYEAALHSQGQGTFRHSSHLCKHVQWAIVYHLCDLNACMLLEGVVRHLEISQMAATVHEPAGKLSQ